MGSHPDFRVIARWAWLMYPAVVLLIIMATLRLGLGTKTIWENQRQAEENARLVSSLGQKWQLLNQVDLLTLKHDMQWLLAVLPSDRQPARLLAQLDEAASLSAVTVTGFRGQKPASDSAGQRLVVALAVADLPALERFLATMEKMLPVVRIGDVSWQSGQAQVEIEEVWHPLPQVATTSAAAALPADPLPQVEQLKLRLADFTPGAVATSGGVTTESANPNPFLLVQ